MTTNRPTSLVRRFALALALAVSAGAGSVAVVSAYTPAGSAINTVQAPGTCTTGSKCPATFHVQDVTGNPITGAQVCFTVTGVAGASVSPVCATTDPGNVTTTFNAGTTGCGTATITANSPPATSAQTTVTVPCSASGGLPNTSALPPTQFPWAGLAGGLALLTLIGSGLALRRTRITS